MDGPDERRIVLLGKTGNGKSSLGNIIMGDSLLTAKESPESETSECLAVSKNVGGLLTTVIDTPGFFDTNMSEEQLKREVVKCIVACAPGPHAFLIVLKVGRYTDQEKKVIDNIIEYFSEEALKYAVLVFTHGDKLSEEMTIMEFVNESKALSDLVKKLNNRCYVFDSKQWNNNNPGDYRNNQYQLNQLLNTVDQMRNRRSCYTNEILTAVSQNRQWDTAKFLAIFGGVTTGALLGALVGHKHCPQKILLSAITGGITGGVVGGAVGYNASTPAEAVTNTIDIIVTANQVINSIQNPPPPPKIHD